MKLFNNYLFLTVISIVLTSVLAVLVSSFHLLHNDFDIYIYYTVYILPIYLFLLPLYLLVSFFVFFISEFNHSFSRRRGNMLLFMSGVVYCILVFIFYPVIVDSNSGWTVYPPLSALPEIEENIKRQANLNPLLKFMFGAAFLIVAMMFFVIIRQRRSLHPTGIGNI